MKKLGSLFLAFVLVFSFYSHSTKAQGFADISASHPFYEEITYLTEKNIIVGFADGFRPNGVVTRAQAAIMIGRALGLNGDPKNTGFTDVHASVTGSGYIASAVEKGIIKGYADTTFKPGNPVTRAQMAIFLDRAFSLTPGQTNLFFDVSPKMAGYQAILNVAHNGIASGYSDGTYKPSVAVTRAQFSAFMARTLEPSFRGSPPSPVTWKGNWTNQFGELSISNQTSNKFDFHINVVMNTHVGDITGTATIQGNTAVYTEYIDSFEGLFKDPTCRITFTNNGDIIKVKETAACTYYHGMAATFDGSYSKEKENNPAQLDVKISNSIEVNGISLGASRQEVLSLLGNPQTKGTSDKYSGDYYGYLVKANNGQDVQLQIHFNDNNKAVSINFDLPQKLSDENWYKNLGEPYVVDHGVTYYYLEGAEQLLMLKPNEPEGGNGYIVHADENFHYWYGDKN
jgi:outer membrane protein assembly factor BamE (lipoprotein component of BamABCDE complex)